MDTREKKIEIACQQVLSDDASVFSIQWIILPERHAADITPAFILERYFSYLRRFTLSLVRPMLTATGLEFRLLSTKLHLLAFAKPVYSESAGVPSVTLHICGGPFVQSKLCNRGAFSFLAEKAGGGIKVTVQLSEYHPRLLGSTSPGRFRKGLYRFSQAFIHKVVTTRFLAALYRELEGKGCGFSIVKANVRPGEEI